MTSDRISGKWEAFGVPQRRGGARRESERTERGALKRCGALAGCSAETGSSAVPHRRYFSADYKAGIMEEGDRCS